MREQLADRPVGIADLAEDLRRRGVQRQQSLVDELEHQHRGEGLGDRADLVLRVGDLAGHVAHALGPREPAVAHDARDDRGHLPLRLRGGQPPAQPPGGVVGDRCRRAGSFGERLGRRARAHQVAVAVRLVDAGHRRPVLVRVRRRSGRRRPRGSRSGPTRRPAPARCAGRGAAASPRGSRSPACTWAISARMAIIASQKRSISARSSDSVGSTIRVPATGKDIVGAWKP